MENGQKIKGGNVMKRKLKQICACILVVSLFVCFGLTNETIVINAAETNNIISGECGENVNYELNTDTGVFRVYGIGPMTDYAYNGRGYAPWIKEYNSVIRKVKIENGVTTIGAYAFSTGNDIYHCMNLESIDIADTVINIGEYAISGCKSLKSITIPDSVKEIKEGAFRGTPLTEIQWGNSIQKIGEGAFAATKFTNLSLPSSIQSIGTYAFDWCKDLKTVEIPDNCEVDYRAFSYCDELESVTIGKNCKIHGQVFYECSMLREILIGEGSISVSTSNNGSDYGSFGYCTGLETILLPDSWSFFDGTEETRAYDGQFSGCNNLKSIQIKSTNKKYTMIDGVVYSKDRKKIVRYPSYLTSSEYEILDGVIEINALAFASQSYLENISIPSTVCEIGICAFLGCRKLNNVIIPEGINELKRSTFAYCPELKKMVWPASIKKIDLNYKDSTATFNGTTVLDVVYGEAGSYAEEWSGEKFQNTIYCSFDANGGTVGEERKPVIYNDKYHKLPEPVRESYRFLGWYTEKESGDLVSKDTVVTKETSHTLYAHWEAETSPQKSIDGATVILGTTNYTYDGREKEPSVVVKDGSITLVNGEHYTVSYENNINVGTATVIITGIGNYTGTVLKTFTISEKREDFVWNKDNWDFNNSSYQGYFSSDKYIDQINSTYLNKLKDNLTNSEYKAIFDSRTGWLHDVWGGSCYGMSSTCLLAMENFLPYSNYKTGATSLYQLNYPLVDGEISSLITYYQLLQVKDVIQQQYRTVPNKSHKENIQNIISLLDENDTVMIGFKKAGWGGHAILAYGYEYGSYSWNGVSYQGCIKICDPNSSKEYDEECNIYFNASTYNWTIPYYSHVPITSVSGAKFNYVGADVNEINYGGYLSGTSNINITDYVARIDAVAVSENRSVTKVSEVNGNYIPQNNAPGDIIEDYSYVLGGESEGTIGYNLYDAESAYKLSQNNAEKLQLSMDYEDCYLEGGSAAGNSIIFDKDGYVSVSGESADYNISMTFDDDYPTDWFTIQVNGENSDEISLEKDDKGYILLGDNLKNVEVSVNNKEDSAHTRFTTEYHSAYIYEIGEETIGVKVDTDQNGTYETLLDTEDTHEYNNYWKSDDNSHWKECKCGQKSELEDHEFKWVIDQDATMVKTGLKHEECVVCGHKCNENTVIDKLPEKHIHNYNSKWKSNTKSHWKNCQCGETAEMGSHTFKWITDKPASVTKTGLKHEECGVCGYIRNKNTIIEKQISGKSGSSTSSLTVTDANSKIGRVTITASKSNKKGKLVLKWGKIKKVKGYQIQYSLKKNFSNKKTKNTKSNQVSFKGLKSKKKYYIRIRAYTSQKGKRQYGKWSKIKKIKIK